MGGGGAPEVKLPPECEGVKDWSTSLAFFYVAFT